MKRLVAASFFLLAAAVPGAAPPDIEPPDCSRSPLLCARLMHSAIGVGLSWSGGARLLSSLSEADFEGNRRTSKSDSAPVDDFGYQKAFH